MNRRDFVAACASFEASLSHEVGIGALLWLGDCYESRDMTASAQREYRRAVEEAHRHGDAREAIALGHVDQLEPRLVKIAVRVDQPAQGERVELDGRLVECRAGEERMVPVDPGRHLVTAMASGRAPWQLAFDATSPDHPVTVVVPDLTSTTVPAPAGPPPLPLPVRGRSQRAAAVVTASVGLAGLVTGATLGFVAIGEKDESRCNATCSPAGQADFVRALHYANGATVALIAGGALAATGGALYLSLPSNRVELRASTTGVRMQVRF